MVDAIVIESLVGKLGGRFFTPILIKVAKILKIKPALPYIEMHVVDHCNLNCKGCGHFSPIAEKWFLNPDKNEKDLERLKKLFSTIHTIRLMGGEPLLHPEIERILLQTRAFFPKSDVRLVTNGIILGQMPESFWETCRTCSVNLDITVYPPLEKKVKSLIELARSEKVRLAIRNTNYFYAFYHSQCASDSKLGDQTCSSGWHICPNLRDGKIYSCPIPAYIFHFNLRFGTSIPSDGYVKIYTPNLTGWDVREAMRKFPSACRYCASRMNNLPKFKWASSTLTITDWKTKGTND